MFSFLINTDQTNEKPTKKVDFAIFFKIMISLGML